MSTSKLTNKARAIIVCIGVAVITLVCGAVMGLTHNWSPDNLETITLSTGTTEVTSSTMVPLAALLFAIPWTATFVWWIANQRKETSDRINKIETDVAVVRRALSVLVRNELGEDTAKALGLDLKDTDVTGD